MIMNTERKLTALRGAMATHTLDGYIVPQTDEYQNEFLPDCYQRLPWLTGFTGSAGLAVVLTNKAVVMSDGRYTIQLKDEVDATQFSVADSTKIFTGKWLTDNAQNGANIGYDPKLFTPLQIDKIKKETREHCVHLTAIEHNLIDQIWHDRPAPPRSDIEVFPHDIAGLTTAQKLQKIATIIKAKNADAVMITAPESVCWLLNIRGHDTPCTPLVLSEVLVRSDASAVWFIDEARVSDDVRAHIGQSVRRVPSLSLVDKLEPTMRVILDLKRSSIYWQTILEQSGCTVIDAKDPCIDIRARKTPSEIRAIKDVHVHDGRAVTKMIEWVAANENKGITEMDVGVKIDELRAEHPAYRGESFNCIAGFAGNGAIIHYRATEKTNAVITGDGLLLVDSGGQYAGDGFYGTTDITRTVAIGAPSDEMREMYTRVLRGHIALARAVFPVGTVGKDIDPLARGALKDIGKNYAHGTGHGVGCYLSVHEESASISWRGETPLAAGMVISNEPGYYKEGAYGIRLENLVLVVEHDETMLGFETISLARFDDRLIMRDMLDDDERAWLDAYHVRVDAALM